MRSSRAFPGPADRDRRRVGRDRRGTRREGDLDQPILAELFSVERLEQHARTLAAAQQITDAPRRGHPVGPRIAENGRVLLASYRILARAIKDERSITPAAEWLVDNFPIVDEQLREIRDDLPPNYYRELPKLAEGHLAGYPRVLGLAWAYIAHTDSRFDPESLRRMVRSYEEVEPLTIGELWAIAISLRILLVENLRRVAEEIVSSRAARERADEIADRLLGVGTEGPGIDPVALRRLSPAALPTPARVQLFQRLRDQDPAVTPAVRWLEDLLAAEGITAEEMVRLEHQRQATMNVTVRNVITSMRLISWFDWAEFVESVSVVDEVLRTHDPYPEMDFATRDRYRDAVEVLARRSGLGEVEIARKAVAMADAAAQVAVPDALGPPQQRDPGYYLISEGRPAFERSLHARVPASERIRRAYVRTAATSYLATVALVTAVLLAVPVGLSLEGGVPGAAILLLSVLALAPASDLAIALVNWAVTNLIGPKALPRLDLDDGVPTRLRTLVVVPMLLTGAADVEAQVDGLEVHYLANREGDLRFALLSDWLDAPAEHVPGDEELLAAAAAGIDRLNERYGEAPGGGARFLLFHRQRRWNNVEGRWMGWERKRGKLLELNALLCGSTTTGILATGRAADDATDRRPLRGDARCGYPAATGRRRAPGGDHRPPAQPGGLRSASGPGGRGLRRAPAADHLHAPRGARGIGVPALLLRIGGNRPVCIRGLGRLPGPVPRRELHRQGDLRPRCLRGGHGGPRTGERPPEPRPLRGRVRPGRSGDRRRAVRRVPLQLPGLGRPPAPLGPWRLAAPALDPGPGT